MVKEFYLLLKQSQLKQYHIYSLRYCKFEQFEILKSSTVYKDYQVFNT